MSEPKKKGVSTRKGFIFFNCDEYKSEQSMNIFYNHVVYKDTLASRKLLLSQIQKECSEKRIFIEHDNLAEVKRFINEDDPILASDYMKFGAIKLIDCL